MRLIVVVFIAYTWYNGFTLRRMFMKQRIRKVWIAHHDHPVFGVKEAHARVGHLSKVGRNVPLYGLDCD